MCTNSPCDRGFYETRGQPLYDDMVGASWLARRRPEEFFGKQIDHVIDVDPPHHFHLHRLEELYKLDFREMNPPDGFREFLGDVVDGIDVSNNLLVRHLEVVAGVESFPDWPSNTARLTATAFTAARGLMVHGHFFELTEAWVLMPMPDRLAHVEETIRPYTH